LVFFTEKEGAYTPQAKLEGERNLAPPRSIALQAVRLKGEEGRDLPLKLVSLRASSPQRPSPPRSIRPSSC